MSRMDRGLPRHTNKDSPPPPPIWMKCFKKRQQCQSSSKKFGFMGNIPSLKYKCSKPSFADIRLFGSNVSSLHNKSRPFVSRKVCLKCGGGLIGNISCNFTTCFDDDLHRNILAFGNFAKSGQLSSDGAPNIENILSI